MKLTLTAFLLLLTTSNIFLVLAEHLKGSKIVSGRQDNLRNFWKFYLPISAALPRVVDYLKKII
ncbi:hypothetical protein RSJ42_11580 [Methanosarcina hadiensis]|uniref:hypothetical protein n=1 Tax=Methanosarcina hadiensis TaxID=3078083 RepID=UPI003977B425|nr:hypothetical protein [Dehalobacter sp.]